LTDDEKTVTPQMRKQYRQLAEMMRSAFLADMFNLKYETIERQFGSEKPPDDYWIFAAARTWGEMHGLLEKADEEGRARVVGSRAALKLVRPQPVD
jgi:hypothetical protein